MSSFPQDAPDLTVPIPRGPVPHLNPPPERASVSVTVDGKTVVVADGDTLLDAARQLGIEIPTLCFIDTLHPVNVCRVCVVELEGSRALVPSCSRRAENGMVVRTDSERVRHSRKMVLEFLASSVDVATAPDLQRYASAAAAEPSRWGSQCATVAQPPKVDNDLYIRDYAKCILCYKCVEACGEDAQNTFAIAVAGRGFDARISTEFDVPLTDSACVYCGNCIAVCPTGALMFKTEFDLRAEGKWDEGAQTVATTVCPYCGVGCNLEVHVQNEQIVKITSPLDHSITSGNLCIKGRFGTQFPGLTGKAAAQPDA